MSTLKAMLKSIGSGSAKAIVVSYTTLYPTQDCWVYKWFPDNNYNAQTYEAVSRTAARIRRSFLQWDISSLSGFTIDSAVLRMYYYYTYDGSPTGLQTDIHRLTESWAEATITYNNQPAYNAGIEDSLNVPASYGWMEWTSLQSLVAEWNAETYTNYGIVVKYNDEGGSSQQGIQFYYRLHATAKPELYIGYH